MKENEGLKIKQFLSECIILDINQLIKERTVELRRKYSLRLPDSIVIATALYLNVPIISAYKELAKVRESDLVLYQK